MGLPVAGIINLVRVEGLELYKEDDYVRVQFSDSNRSVVFWKKIPLDDVDSYSIGKEFSIILREGHSLPF